MTVWLAAIKDGHGPILFSGHGNPAVAMSPDTPLYVQVGDPKYGFHSNHLCIVVLPCPHTLGICASECFSVACFLLKLSGNVEENPGPVEDNIIKEVLQSQREILAKITDIQEKQQASETAMSLVEKRLETIESKLLGVDEVNTRLVTLEGSMRNFDEQFNQMSKRIDDLENRSRRNNIIVRGIEEEVLETEEVLIRKVNDEVFGNILKQKLHSIERIHRLGRKIPGTNRPVILRVGDFREKTKIFKHCSKLKGTPFSVPGDFSKRVAATRKNLWNSTAEERKTGAKVIWAFDKIKVNNVLYAWDEVNSRRWISKTPI
ncbi:uncharacterized protein LOC144143361 [Haemaphysalis longicornis]